MHSPLVTTPWALLVPVCTELAGQMLTEASRGSVLCLVQAASVLHSCVPRAEHCRESPSPQVEF